MSATPPTSLCRSNQKSIESPARDHRSKRSAASLQKERRSPEKTEGNELQDAGVEKAAIKMAPLAKKKRSEAPVGIVEEIKAENEQVRGLEKLQEEEEVSSIPYSRSAEEQDGSFETSRGSHEKIRYMDRETESWSSDNTVESKAPLLPSVHAGDVFSHVLSSLCGRIPPDLLDEIMISIISATDNFTISHILSSLSGKIADDLFREIMTSMFWGTENFGDFLISHVVRGLSGKIPDEQFREIMMNMFSGMGDLNEITRYHIESSLSDISRDLFCEIGSNMQATLDNSGAGANGAQAQDVAGSNGVMVEKDVSATANNNKGDDK